MLRLRRRHNEAILLHTTQGTITVRIDRVGTKAVGVLIDAPTDVRVVREEIADRDRETAVTT